MTPLPMSLVLFVEVLHPVNFVNITHVKSMLSYYYINSHFQVSDLEPKGPLVLSFPRIGRGKNSGMQEKEFS